jgi:hypothetical protein
LLGSIACSIGGAQGRDVLLTFFCELPVLDAMRLSVGTSAGRMAVRDFVAYIFGKHEPVLLAAPKSRRNNNAATWPVAVMGDHIATAENVCVASM